MRSVRSALETRPWVAAVVVALVVGLGGTAAQAAPPSGLQVDQTRTDELITAVDTDRSTFGGISFDRTTGVATVRYAADAGARSAQARLAGLASPRSSAATSAA